MTNVNEFFEYAYSKIGNDTKICVTFVSLNNKTILNMKKLLLSILTVGTLVITSCTSDPCKDKSAATQCSGNGTLVSGTSTCDCSCNVGFEGTDCATKSSTKFIGSWTALDRDGSGTNVGPYASPVAEGTTTGTIIIGNFSNLGAPVNATVSGDKVTIGNQVLGTAYTVSGSGTYSKTTTGSASINMTYAIVKVATSQTLNYTGTWTK